MSPKEDLYPLIPQGMSKAQFSMLCPYLQCDGIWPLEGFLVLSVEPPFKAGRLFWKLASSRRVVFLDPLAVKTP